MGAVKNNFFSTFLYKIIDIFYKFIWLWNIKINGKSKQLARNCEKPLAICNCSYIVEEIKTQRKQSKLKKLKANS